MKETDLTKFGIEKYDPYTWYFVTTIFNDKWLVRGNLLKNNETNDPFHVIIEKDGSYGYVDKTINNQFINSLKNINDIRLATQEEIKRVESYFGLKSREEIKKEINIQYGKSGNNISHINANQAKELFQIGFEKQKQSFMADIMYRINTVFGGGFDKVEMNVDGYNGNVVKECIIKLRELGYCVELYDIIVSGKNHIVVTLPK